MQVRIRNFIKLFKLDMIESKGRRVKMKAKERPRGRERTGGGGVVGV